LIGMAKAFAELGELGWLQSAACGLAGSSLGSSAKPQAAESRGPRLISCQSDGCAPIVTAFERGQRFPQPFANAPTAAGGLRVPAAVGDFMMLDAIRVSGGLAVAGREEQIVPWMRRVASAEGIAICPETAVCFDVLERLVAAGKVGADEEIIVFNTG